MKIMVVGSIKHQLEEIQDAAIKDNLFDKFKKASYALGMALAQRRHDIYGGIPDWEYYEKEWGAIILAIKGAASVVNQEDKRKPGIVFYAPEEINTPTTVSSTNHINTLRNQCPSLHIDSRPIKGFVSNTGAKIIPNLSEVDAVVLLAGYDGTASIGYAAKALNVPVIAIPKLPGSGQDLYYDFVHDKLAEMDKPGNQKMEPDEVLDTDFWSTVVLPPVNKPIQPDPQNKPLENIPARDIVSLIERYVAYRKNLGTKNDRMLNITSFLGLVSLIGWVVLYVEALRGKLLLDYTFFIMLAVASIIGAELRVLLEYREGKKASNWTQVLVDVIVSLMVSIGLAIVYLIGGISFTGEVVTFNPTDTATFATIGLSISLLGLASGVLIPVQQLLDQLRKAVSAVKLPEEK